MRAVTMVVLGGLVAAAVAAVDDPKSRPRSEAKPEQSPFLAAGPHHVPFSVTARGVTIVHERLALFLLPSESIIVTATPRRGDRALVLSADGGRVEELARNQWRYRAPEVRKQAHMVVGDPASERRMTLTIIVLVPFTDLHGEELNGYLIGSYPEPTARPIYQPPRGFVEVTRQNQETPVGPHFVLRQFLCKQKGDYPKYLVLEERLVLALEAILEKLHGLGHRAETLGFISAYRTPAYNAALKDVRYSRHQWGDAADIMLDVAPRDDLIDDLDGDGRTGIGDARVLHEMIDGMDLGGGTPFQGGLGLYGPTPTHPPFVHVDMRGFHARWDG